MGEEMEQGPSILSDLCFDIDELCLILTPPSYADNVSPFKRTNYLYSKILAFSFFIYKNLYSFFFIYLCFSFFIFYLQSKLLAG